MMNDRKMNIRKNRGFSLVSVTIMGFYVNCLKELLIFNGNSILDEAPVFPEVTSILRDKTKSLKLLKNLKVI